MVIFVVLVNVCYIAKARGEEIGLVKDGGVYKLPVTINDSVTLKFIVDTGAAEVLLPVGVVLTLIRTETIDRSDVLAPGNYQTADGSVTQNMRVRLRRLQIGNHRLANVTASIGDVESSLLLGQSALEKLEPWRLDSQRNVFIVESAGGIPAEQQLGQTAPKRIVTARTDPKTWQEPITGMEFAWVSKGCYKMGCGTWTSACNDDEAPVHEVCLDGFWMGKTEVTQRQWKRVMGRVHPSSWGGDDYPVEWASWQEAQDFARKLEELNTGQAKFRLPTEAEWEYACRSGGRPENYSGGNDADLVAWYNRNSHNDLKPVGMKLANALGLFDMSGNIAEWTFDIYDAAAYRNHQRQNPTVTTGSLYRVVRGGGWTYSARGVRCSKRYPNFDSSTPYGMIGFRLVRDGTSTEATAPPAQAPTATPPQPGFSKNIAELPTEDRKSIERHQGYPETLFYGLINNNIIINMSMVMGKGSISGRGWYERYKILFPISGEINNGYISIREFAGKNQELTGIFIGEFVSDKAIEGTYSKPDGSKLMPFFLKIKQ
jgi:clan AA aspartic protease (TIGR02281 family)